MATFMLPNRPMTFSEAIVNSFRLWWRSLSSVIIFSLAAGLLNSLSQLYISPGTPLHLINLPPLHIGILVCIFLAGLIPNIAIFAKLGHIVHGGQISFSQALAVSLLKFPQVCLFFILTALFSSIPFFLIFHFLPHSPQAASSNQLVYAGMLIFFIITYVIVISSLVVYLALTLPAIINDNHPLITAAKKSIQLIRGQWWYSGIMISIPVFFELVGELILILFLGKIGIIIGQAVFLPLNIAFITILYEHQKLRPQSQNPHA